MKSNDVAKIVDELNERMEDLLDGGNDSEADELKSFYDWFLENYVY